MALKSKSPSRSSGKYRPVNPLQLPRFSGITTFSRLPYLAEIKGQNVDVAVLGVPTDAGTTFRPGARFGPRSIRQASVLCRNYHPELAVNIYDRLGIVDAGDIEVNPLNLKKTSDQIESRIREIHEAGARSVCMGGDHSIVLPILRAVRSKFGPPTLIQFDAHTDTADQAWGEKYHHGTPIRRAIEEGLLNGKRIFQIGIRGPLTSEDQDDYIREQKINVLDMNAFHDSKKREAFFKKLHQTAGDGPCYLSFDVDGVDPAFTPGTGTPVVGGLTSFEALDCVRRLKGLRLVGADVVEISPPYDHAELTSLFGAALVFEFLSLMAL